MVSNSDQIKRRRPVSQGVHADIPGHNKIGACTPYDFEARNLTAWRVVGRLLWLVHLSH
jgi:hypothetical protein